MELRDYSPPPTPTLDQLRDALQKGLGRAMQWALAGQLANEPLLDACLNDKRFDLQCEGNRGEWLWNLIVATHTAQKLRPPIFKALRDTNPGRNGYQLCDLVFHFAQWGDREAKELLYDFVRRRPVADLQDMGEWQLQSLAGEEAFLIIARIRGRQLANRKWEWDDEAIVDRAVEQLDKERIDTLLSESTDRDVRQFGVAWRNSKANTAPSTSEGYTARMKAISIDQVLMEAASFSWRGGSFRGWGASASEEDLNTVALRLQAAQEPLLIANLLKVFCFRSMPTFDSRLFEFFHHDDQDVRHWSMRVLEAIRHPAIREFALRQLESPPPNRSVVGLFVKNYSTGDERRILNAVELPPDDHERHGLLIDVLQLLEQNEEADCSRLGLIAYFHTPCEMCRCRAVELLVNDGAAPAWLIDECRNDSSEECRDFMSRTILESDDDGSSFPTAH